MSQIGNWGKTIIFSTDEKKILTFNGFTQDITAKWANHDIIGEKPKSEFLGPELRQISMKISLNAIHGVKPRKTLDTLESCVETGKHAPLVIGGKKVGKNDWKITKISEAWNTIYSKGELVQADVTLSLEEYR